ncbi:MAG: MFS transporter [Dehalococcoidia bacterium]
MQTQERPAIRSKAITSVANPAQPSAKRKRALPRTFVSFENSVFRWYFGAMVGWMAAANMQLLVRGYLVYELTGSYAKLGVIGLASGFPMLIFAPWGGVIADRAPRKLVLQVGQAISMVIAIGVAIMLFAGILRFEHLFIASLLQGTVMAMMMPSRQAMLPEVVGIDGLQNAVPLNAAGMNIMRMMGPALGGTLIVVLSPGWVYGVMAAMYLSAVLLLFKVHITPVEPDRAREKSRASGFRDLIEGAKYAVRDRVIFVLLVMSFFTSLLAMPYLQMLPGYVSDVFDGNAVALGTMTGASGAGALVGALALASYDLKRRGLMLILGAGFLGAALLLFTLTPVFWLAAGFMLLVGLGTAIRQALAQVLLQTYVEDDYRGRVMALYMTQFSLMQFGTFFVGLYSDVLGVRFAIGSLGLSLVLVSAILVVVMPRLRQLD